MATNDLKSSQPKTDDYPKPKASTNIKQPAKQQFTNRLVNSKSSYLLQHAHNPVDWYPWGEEAFKHSLEKDKPILLSIGYSTCHWCHVMMHECFENKDIANLMNKYYICVKVDREELPTVDQIYQAYVENLSEGGGWPLTCFLTPHLKPFFGGTYFSPEPKNGMPGFATILKNIASNWRTNHQSILVNAIDDFTQLKETIKLADGDMGNVPINAFSHLHLAEKTFSLFKAAFDWQYGGISEDCNRSKFPRVSVFRFFMWFHTVTCVPQDVIDDVQRLGPSQMEISKMVRLAEGFGIDTTSIPRKYMHGILVDKLRMRRVQACEALEIVEATAGKMAAGGIHDWVGGGFHRYAVERAWRIPHFEKMLYDQGQLLSLYSDLFAITKKPLYEQVATGIFKYLCRDMKHPEGAFYGGQDADCEVIAGSGHKEEGSVYLWTESEIDQVLGADSAIFKSHYNIKTEGNVNSIDDESGELQGKNVVYEVQTLAETAVQYKLREDDLSKKLEKCRETLLEVREQRPQPHREEKIVTSWNGLTISGLAKAGRVFQNEDMVLSACSAATFIRKYMYNERTGTLIRQFDSSAVGYADDYAFLIDGLLELYSATWDDSWIEWAVNLQMTMNRLFWDSNSGGYFSGGNETGVLIRMKEDSDKSEPSAGSVAVYNLLRLDALMGSTLPGDTARRTSLTKSLGSVASLSDKQTRNLTFKERAHRTLMAHYVGLSQLPRSLPYMVCGAMAFSRELREIVIHGTLDSATQRFLQTRFDPFSIVIRAQTGYLTEQNSLLRSIVSDPDEGGFHIYVCDAGVCHRPASTLVEIQQLLKK